MRKDRLSDLDKLRLEIQRKYPEREFDCKSFPGFVNVSSKLSQLVLLKEISRIPIEPNSVKKLLSYRAVRLKKVADPCIAQEDPNNRWSGLLVNVPTFQNQSRVCLGARHINIQR